MIVFTNSYYLMNYLRNARKNLNILYVEKYYNVWEMHEHLKFIY